MMEQQWSLTVGAFLLCEALFGRAEEWEERGRSRRNDDLLMKREISNPGLMISLPLVQW